MPSTDSIKNTLLVALGVCFVSSILVSATVVSLRATQQENARLDKMKNILSAGDLYSEGIDIEKTYNERIKAEIINLSNGTVVPEDEFEGLNPTTFDVARVSSDPKYSQVLESGNDPAGIKRRPDKMVIYEVMKDGAIDKLILPIHGQGLWSTLYGFIAIDNDLQTIRGITFYQHGETPGLGGEVDNPNWKAQWNGKMAFDDDHEVIIEVLKGKVDPTSAQANSQIDGLSGSTLTTRGVHNLVRYWLGENGYGPLFERLRKEDADHEQQSA
jgi:Na+-transporting NADH:ubiquinone oxidoreductase subunit C